METGDIYIFLFINVKMPTIVDILTFMSRKNSIIGLSEPEKAEFPDFFVYLWAFKISRSAEFSMIFITSGPDFVRWF